MRREKSKGNGKGMRLKHFPNNGLGKEKMGKEEGEENKGKGEKENPRQMEKGGRRERSGRGKMEDEGRKSKRCEKEGLEGLGGTEIE